MPIFDQNAYCRRLQLLRAVYRMNQTEFADFVGIDYKKWNHYERGYPIPRETAWVLLDKIDGFATDWLWFGLQKGLSEALATALLDVQRAPEKE
jgi:hypothetical protein